MRFHPVAFLLAATLVAACSSGDDAPPVVGDVEDPISPLDRPAEPTPEVAATTQPTQPTPDAAAAPTGAIASDLILVQDFGGTIQLASYEPDGDLAAVYVRGEDEVAWQPIWAPDGSAVAWASTPGDGSWKLVVADVDGTIRSEAPLPGRPDYLTFDPTASRIASLTPSPDGFGLAIIELDGSGAAIVDIGRPYYSDFAPDGRRLVSHVAADVRIVSVDGAAEPTGIATGGHQTPTWHPDGDRILVTGEGDGPATLIAYDVTSGTATDLGSFGDFISFDIDPAGTTVAVTSFVAPSADDTGTTAVDALRAATPDAAGSGLWIIDLDTLETRQLSSDITTPPLFDPTGRRILVRDAVAGVGSWTVHHIDGAEITSVRRDVTSSLMPNYLPFWDQYIRSQTLWSPQGDRFVHVGTDENGQAGVWIHSAEVGGESKFLVDGELAFWSPT